MKQSALRRIFFGFLCFPLKIVLSFFVGLAGFFHFILDRIYRISWIFSFGRSPDESAQTPIASGE
jgi:hypothetical protein